MARLLLSILVSMVLVACLVQGGSLSPAEEAEYAEFESSLFEGSLTLERTSSVHAQDILVEEQPFVNPLNAITVTLNTKFTLLRNHTNPNVKGRRGSGSWDLVTQLGSTPCTDFKAQHSTAASCSADGLTLHGVKNVNIDPVTLDGQFEYTFVTSSKPSATIVTFCALKAWETSATGCAGRTTQLKVLITDDAVSSDELEKLVEQ